ncbi:MAG: hypothetical protein GX663_09015 [Clostridiales bacterium]|nr:hypothetical protein [Clostridiales bacterium]
MSEQDTINLLRETSKGVQMAIFSFDDLIGHVKNPALKKVITESRNDHKRLHDENANLLKGHKAADESLGMMAKGMAHMSMDTKLGMEDSDRVIAGIITKGCDTGTRNLYKYINEYAGADLTAAETAKKLINIEENLEENLRVYL